MMKDLSSFMNPQVHVPIYIYIYISNLYHTCMNINFQTPKKKKNIYKGKEKKIGN